MIYPKNRLNGLEAIENEMIQAFYGENGSDMLIRKALGNEDISGDYNEYAQIETADGVTLKGAEGQFSLALWTDSGFAYSLSLNEGIGEAEWIKILQTMIA